MHSTTKYLNGTRRDWRRADWGPKPEHKERFLLVQKAAGSILSPFECFLFCGDQDDAAADQAA